MKNFGIVTIFLSVLTFIEYPNAYGVNATAPMVNVFSGVATSTWQAEDSGSSYVHGATGPLSSPNATITDLSAPFTGGTQHSNPLLFVGSAGDIIVLW